MKRILPSVSDNTALYLLRTSNFFYHFMIILPVIVILYQSKGITVGDFFLIQGLSRLTSFFSGLPSGYLSDTFSRRRTLLLGVAAYLGANIWLYTGTGFWNIAGGEILWGITVALFSETKESYTYDLLKRMGREKQFLKENGTLATWGQIGSFIATLIGGALYARIGNNIFILEIIAAVIALICVVFLPELVEVKRTRKNNTNIIKDVAHVVKMSVKHKEIKWLMIFPSIFGSFTYILFWLIQPTFDTLKVAVGWFGIFMAMNQLWRLFFAKFADTIYTKMGAKRLLKIICVLLFVTFLTNLVCINLGLGIWTYVLMTFVVMGPALQQLCSLIFSSLIHERIESAERGTIMSVNAMCMTIMNAVALFAMKPLMDGLGINVSVTVAMLTLFILLWPLQKVLQITR